MGAIGVFDSGLGGFTVLKALREQLPEYSYVYLGDNARAPYGSHSFETIYQYTRECVHYLFEQGCPLVILACNTASARALRTLQQVDLPKSKDSTRRILGVIRPTVEALSGYTVTGKVGIVGTNGTVQSGSYPMEIAHLHPHIQVFQQACPMWVPLVENHEVEPHAGTMYFLKRDMDRLLSQCQDIDTLLLGCTHYPILLPLLKQVVPAGIRLLSQGDIVAKSLTNYLERHPEMERRLNKDASLVLLTTGTPSELKTKGKAFAAYLPSHATVQQVVVSATQTL